LQIQSRSHAGDHALRPGLIRSPLTSLLTGKSTAYDQLVTFSPGERRPSMRTIGANGVGRFSVEFEIVNREDLVRAKDGTIPRNNVRRMKIAGVVDPGAVTLVLPQAVVKNLGLPLGDKIKVRYADGRRAQRRVAEEADVKLLGRHDTFSAIVEPKRNTALIGVFVLEILDLLVDPKNQRLIPRDPKGPRYEIE
jgi:clan AA aspartic protease